MSRANDVIRASEITQYAFCARAWWFGRVKGYRSANVAAMRRGTARHQAHGAAVARYHLLRWLAVVLLVLAGLVLITWLLWVLAG